MAAKLGLVSFVDDPAAAEGGFLSSAAFSGRDDMEVSVHGGGGRAVLVSRFDNLGKGASGAAIQNMNVVLGCDEREGLVV
jgi:N-acetyl-gamma-glutamyl-phosphate reductase